jgi:hypothetical protein
MFIYIWYKCMRAWHILLVLLPCACVRVYVSHDRTFHSPFSLHAHAPHPTTGGANAAKRIKVEDIGDEVKALSKKFPLKIPAYFGLIVRTFSALEGLGLGLDGQYSIINQVNATDSRE